MWQTMQAVLCPAAMYCMVVLAIVGANDDGSFALIDPDVPVEDVLREGGTFGARVVFGRAAAARAIWMAIVYVLLDVYPKLLAAYM